MYAIDHLGDPWNLEAYLPTFGCPGGLVFLKAKAQGMNTLNARPFMIWGGDNSYRVLTPVSWDTKAWNDIIPLPDDRYQRPLDLIIGADRINPEILVCNVSYPILSIHYSSVPGVAGIVYNSGATNHYARSTDEVKLGNYIVNSTGSGQEAIVYYAYAYVSGEGNEIITVEQKTIALPSHGWAWASFDSRPASDFPPGVTVFVYHAVKHNGVLRQLGTPFCFKID